MKFLHLLACVSVLSISPLLGARAQTSVEDTPAGWATVTGRVLDSEGRPVAGAEISVFPIDVAASGALPRRPITDEEGKYRLLSPAYQGRTRLCAVKESAGYPDIQALVFASGRETKDSMPEIHLTVGGRLDNVDIRLGPPDGTIEGSVVDAKTGASIPKARITLERPDLDGAKYSTSLFPDGHFFFAIPPAPIQITVVAPGYLPWIYKDSRSGATKLVLDAREHRTLTVELVPK